MNKEIIFKKYRLYALAIPYQVSPNQLENLLKPYVLFSGNIVFLNPKDEEHKPTEVTAENYEEVVNKLADMFIDYAEKRGGDNSDLISGLMIGMTSPYRLQFLSFIKDDITAKELAEALAWCWTQTEFPHNYSTQMLLSLFKSADRQALMDEEEQAYYDKLPEEIIVYRGTQTEKAKVRALSWTLDKEKAEWFANRWKTTEGKVYEATIKKKDIFAYFNGRNESEVIVNPRGLKEIRISGGRETL